MNKVCLAVLLSAGMCCSLVAQPATGPVITISAIEPEASENPGAPARFAIRRDRATRSALRVFYRVSGTALNGEDYETITNSVVIPRGQRAARVTINPVDDSEIEETETVELRLVASSRYRRGSARGATVRIADNDSPPSVMITAPEEGSVFRAPASIEIGAHAVDVDGTVALLEFFADNDKIGEQLLDAADVEVSSTWTNANPGTHTLTVKATDNNGLSSTSAPVHITVDPPCHETVVLSSATGTIEFFPEMGTHIVFTNPPGSPIQSRYSKTFSDNRSFRRGFIEFAIPALTAPVVDAKLMLADGAPGSGTVPRSDTILHELAYYAADLTVDRQDYDAAASTLQTFVTRQDLQGETFALDVTRVVSELRGTNVGFRIKLHLDPALDGIDSFGEAFRQANQENPPRLVITTCPNKAPTIHIAAPAGGGIFTAPANIPISATTIDPDGSAAKIEFFANGQKIGERTLAPVWPPGQARDVSMLWSNVPAGEYALVAIATDNNGATNSSAPVSITVDPACDDIVLGPVATGTVVFYPERNLYQLAGGMIQSTYAKTIPDNRRFRRGFLEFAIPPLSNDVVSAILYLADGAPGSSTGPRTEPIEHELSYYVGDLAIDTNDFHGPRRELAFFETHENRKGEFFRIDVTRAVAELSGTNIGFRIKLTADPTYDAIDSFGEAFRETNQASPPRLVISLCPNQAPYVDIIAPQDGAEIRASQLFSIMALATDPDGYVPTVEFFAGTNSIGISTNRATSRTNVFSVSWVAAPGIYELRARATDNRGRVSMFSQPRFVRVVDRPLPPVGHVMAGQASLPASSRISLFGVTRGLDGVHFSFTGEPGYDYFVEATDSLDSPNWIVVTNYRAKFEPIQPVIIGPPGSGAARFYRLRKQDCNCR